jgi:transcriptional regulator with XRE-family HTH domain
MSTGKINESGFFSDRLKSLRKDANKAVFSRKLGLSPQTYQHYEDGRIPRSDILGTIAERCGVSIDWLLGRDDSPPPTLSVELHDRGVMKLEKGQAKTETPVNIGESQLRDRGVLKLEKGQAKTETPINIGGSQLQDRGVLKLEKGQAQGECRYPAGCDLEGELAAVRERLADTTDRLAEVEATLSHMSSQLETVVGLLGHALGDGIKTTRPREGGERKAG